MSLTAIERIREDAAFFDRLVELIPAKFYFTDASAEVLQLRHMKKEEREKARTELKKKHKEMQRMQLNPETAKGTLEIQRLRAEEIARKKSTVGEEADGEGNKEETGTESTSSEYHSASDESESECSDSQEPIERRGDGEDGQEAESHKLGSKSTGAVLQSALLQRVDEERDSTNLKRDELHRRLQEKLEQFRKQRKADEQGKRVKDAKNWRETTLEKSRQRAAEKRKSEKRKGRDMGANVEAQRRPNTSGDANKNHKGNEPGTNADLFFTKVDFDEGGSGARKKRKHQKSKAEMLAELERKDALVEGNDADDTNKGNAQNAKGGWSAALARAKGEKVFDDAKLLRRSVKKEAKLKKKRSEAWAERLDKQKEAQTARQNKRRDNLQARAQARKEKKKARREKKLLRAGFEGRKEGFIKTPTK